MLGHKNQSNKINPIKQVKQKFGTCVQIKACVFLFDKGITSDFKVFRNRILDFLKFKYKSYWDLILMLGSVYANFIVNTSNFFKKILFLRNAYFKTYTNSWMSLINFLFHKLKASFLIT